MNTYRYLLLYCITLLPISVSNAQVQPPDFLCVTNNTLRWEAPMNTCGPFNSYLVYGSLENVQGPYSVIATINDPAVVSFFHAAANPGETWYYYLLSDFECPGLEQLSSDTLDNRIPETSPIEYVTVIGDEVEIAWDPSPSPEVFANIIYKQTPTGTAILDTVFTGNTYRDANADPSQMTETYFVNSLDRCGNISLFTEPQSTILLEISDISICEQTIRLDWNLYQNWTDGIDRHEVWVSRNGAPSAIVETVSGTTNSYTFQNANDKDTYCFSVRAVRTGTEVFSNSNEVCETLDIVQPVKDFILKNVSYNGTGGIEVSWTWDPTSEIASFAIDRTLDIVSFETLVAEAPTTPLTRNNTFVDESPELAGAPIFYRISAVDDCEQEAATSELGTVHLVVAPLNNGQNDLSWTSYDNTNAQTTAYEIHRVTGGNDELIQQVDLSQLEFVDQLDLSQPGQSGACYYIVAIADLTLPDGTTEVVRSRSNTVCVEQQAQVFVPNAFVPDGFNTEFKPLLQFGAPENYILSIYDRWGDLVFESTSIEVGWDGKKNGKLVPQGVYAYYIRVAQTSGVITVKKGTVLLLRLIEKKITPSRHDNEKRLIFAVR